MVTVQTGIWHQKWEKFKHWCLVTWHQLDNWQSLVLFALVCAVVYSPVWGGYLLYFLFHFKWALWLATAVLAFWAAPFTPFFPICMAITLAIKKFLIHTHRKARALVHTALKKHMPSASRNS